MVDVHLHILPGVDDGPADLAESLSVARALVAEGVRIAVATPHVRDDYPTPLAEMRGRVAQLRAALAEQGVPLDVRTGGEVAIDRLPALDDDEVRGFSIGGAGRHLLLEFPYSGWPLALPAAVERLRSLGMSPVIAHPERSAEVQRDPALLGPMVGAGALVQLTASSLAGRPGSRSRAAGFRLLELGLAHVVASDAHAAGVRPIALAAAVAAVGDRRLAGWLTRDAGAALVAGSAPPPRPEAQPERREAGGRGGVRRLWSRR